MARTKKAATKSASEIRKEHIARVTHKPAPEHSSIKPHNGPPHEPDRKDIGVEKGAEASPRTQGRKPRQLTTDERLDRLEALHAAMVVKLRPHGIHVQSPDERETEAEVQAGQATPVE